MSELKERGAHKKESADAKRHFERLEEQQKRTEEDKKRAVHLADKLHLDGTREGAREVDAAMTGTGEVLDGLMEAQKRSHDRASSQERSAEEKLGSQARAAEGDAGTARGEGSRFADAGARREVEAAARAAEEDGRFLKQLRTEREEERKGSDARTVKRVEKVKGTKVRTKLRGSGQ